VVFQRKYVAYFAILCPKCHAENEKLSHDLTWVDEMAEYDAVFEDDKSTTIFDKYGLEFAS
jgi:hypothetical protein